MYKILALAIVSCLMGAQINNDDKRVPDGTKYADTAGSIGLIHLQAAV